MLPLIKLFSLLWWDATVSALNRMNSIVVDSIRFVTVPRIVVRIDVVDASNIAAAIIFVIILTTKSHKGYWCYSVMHDEPRRLLLSDATLCLLCL